MINGPIFRFPTRMALAILAIAICAFPSVCRPLCAADKLTEGSSSKQFRMQAVASIPFDRLNGPAKNKISDVVKKPNVYRRLPVTSINMDADYFKFLVRYPEVIVNIWQLMGVTKMTTERTGPFSISTNDGAGTISDLELVYGTDNQHIFFGTGTYEGPILKRKLTGKCVLVLTSKSGAGASGKPTVTSQLDVFLKIENATAGLIAKTIAPIVGSTADHNFVESLKFVQRLNSTTEKNGPGVQKMGTRLDLSDDVRERFNETVDLVFQRAINATPVTQAMKPASQRAVVSQNLLQSGGAKSSSIGQPQTGFAPAYQQPVRHQPARNAAPVYESFNDGRANYRRQSGYSTDSSQYQAPAINRLPARGSQAPVYPAQHYPQQYMGQQVPVRASYDLYGQQGQVVQPASGWRPRR